MIEECLTLRNIRMRSMWSSQIMVGYYIAMLVADECEILSVAIRPEHRRKGYAQILLEDLIGEGRKQGIQAIYLEVRSGNSAARAFYAFLGYEMVGERRAYYRDGEDAVVLRLNISND